MFLDGANDNLYNPSRFTISKSLGYSLIAATRRLTKPMHADRRESMVMIQRLSAAGDGQRYAVNP
jgi:hypothetical protein